jgi:integrase
VTSFKTAWVRQLPSQLRKHGPKRAAWYVEWREPDGTQRCRSCGPGSAGRRAAERLRDQLRAQLVTRTYKGDRGEKQWQEFCGEYRDTVLAGLRSTTRVEAVRSLDRFTRMMKPKLVSLVTTESILRFVAKRRQERGRKPKSHVSPATINKDIRTLRAALRMAVEWGYLERPPKFKFEREPKKLPRYVTPEHFAAIYKACESAKLPADSAVPAPNWWRGLLTMAQMTGWRLGELLSLEWRDVDLDSGTAITRHHDNKGHRDAKVVLHPVVVESLRPLRSFDALVFPWNHHPRTLYEEFERIQQAAGIHLPCGEAGDPKHGECTRACHRYTFHDERRSFATLNAPNMTRETLQVLMRDQSPMTTDRYINMARQLNPAIAALHVPDVLRSKSPVAS